MPTKAEVLENYMAFRGLTNKTANGLRDIRFHINKFLTHTNTPLDKFDEPLLILYVNEINKKYKITMSNTVKSSYLKNFIKWYFEDWSSRFRNLKKICQTTKAEDTYSSDDMLTEEEVQKIIQDEESVFWKAYFLTLFYGSCRPVEVVNLKWDDVEFEDDGAFFTIKSKKNKREFIKFVPSDVAFYLKKIKRNNEYVFVNNRTGKPITVKGAYWKLNKMSQKTLGKKVNLYVLRHSIATINYDKCGENGIEENDVANQLGHNKSMRSTYEHKNKERLKQRAKKIYFKSESLPPEQREAMQKQIDDLKETVAKMENYVLAASDKGFMEHLKRYRELDKMNTIK